MMPVLHIAGPVRTQRKSTQASPMTPALKTHILGNIAMAEANKAQVTAPLIENESVEPGKPAQHSSQSTLTNGSSVSQEPPSSSPVPDDNISDGLSYTSSISDFFDIGNDDSGPLATGPWTIIDHFTGDMIVDEEEVPPAPPAASVRTTQWTQVVLALRALS